MSTVNNVKPFYIYTDKNYLYLKNINSHTEKLCNNIYAYSANIDDNNKIHICCIDLNGRLIHIYNKNNSWKKKIVCKAFNSIKNIKNLRLYIANNFLNLFIIEDNPLSEGVHRISHLNFSPKNYKVSNFHINNVLKENSYIYKLNIDNLSNFILQYKSSSYSRCCNNTIVYNSKSRIWVNTSSSPQVYDIDNNLDFNSNIKDEIFDYCYSIEYKI